MDYNRVILAGRLTKAPELKSTKGGQSVATFSLATNRTWNDKNNQKQVEVEYHNIVVWGKQAEIASKWLEKGQVALVEGRIATRSYEDRSGVKKYVTEIIAEQIKFGQKPSVARAEPSPLDRAMPASEVEEIPVINIDSEITAESLPF